MSKERICSLLQNSYVPFNYIPDLEIIKNENENESARMLMVLAFTYGIIIGKQQDRARRKKSGVNA